MWFEKLTGFQEISPQNVRKNIVLDGTQMTSLVNGRKFTHGSLEITDLQDLRQRFGDLSEFNGGLKVSELLADVRDLHIQKENVGALFQVASQFNLLEMVSPDITPEMGIERYQWDKTQGPICAMACGAGTIYRNYFVKMGRQSGQNSSNQIDCLDEMGIALENDYQQYWKMKNGYALMDFQGLSKLNSKLNQLNASQREQLKGKLKVGIQWQTEVTAADRDQLVSQIYCSALPVAYCSVEKSKWEAFARLVLEASYEASMYAALKNRCTYGSPIIYLTLLGGGAFGNESAWIVDSMGIALEKFRNVPLDVRIVSYGSPNKVLHPLLDSWNKAKDL